MKELIAVMTFDSRMEAEIAGGLLTEQGIESIIRADDCGGMLMGVSLIRKGGIKLLVADDDLDESEQILEVLNIE